MTWYDGGCQHCGRHKGKFIALLPNGVCVHTIYAGWYFCDECEKYLKQFRTLVDIVIQSLC